MDFLKDEKRSDCHPQAEQNHRPIHATVSDGSLSSSACTVVYRRTTKAMCQRVVTQGRLVRKQSHRACFLSWSSGEVFCEVTIFTHRRIIKPGKLVLSVDLCFVPEKLPDAPGEKHE